MQELRIALAGNPNSGKTTLFNALTGSNQYVGNWPGVTVEKKEGKLKKREDITIIDLPGIYSLSPYTLEEVVARNYLISERPDVILNIVDGTNLDRNFYLSPQLTELGIPVMIAFNMIDIVNKAGDIINLPELSKAMGCPIVEISALRSQGLMEAAEAAITAAQSQIMMPMHNFSGPVEHALAHIEEAAVHEMPLEQQRWYAIKIFERDPKVMEQMKLPQGLLNHIQQDILSVEKELDDDAESLIINERYNYIDSLMKTSYTRKSQGKLSDSDKIDRVLTNRFAALPIFALIMFLIYFISVTTVGSWATNWANEGLFGKGWHLPGGGAAQYTQAQEAYRVPEAQIKFFQKAAKAAGVDAASARSLSTTAYLYDENGQVEEAIPTTYEDYTEALNLTVPEPSQFGTWVPGIPVLLGSALEGANVAPWLQGLLRDGIVGGVGAVLGFVPQMFVLFFLLAFLEACGYMSRIAFIMDRVFRKFGLSGKSFIPILIGSGCSVPGIMASRTIENERDRRITIMTTSFMPCGAKLPIIALIAGAMFGGAPWVGPSAYFVGIGAIVLSGIILKKTKRFAGDPAPFVMELPAYHMPTLRNLLNTTWERGWSFVKKAGTIILLSTIFIWFASNFGFAEGSFGMVPMNESLLAQLGSAIAIIFTPLGWGNWQSAVATVTGLIAKENVVSTLGVLFGDFEEVAENGWQVWANLRGTFSPLAGYSFLLFNLLCAPCFAAVGAMRRELGSAGWTSFAVLYQTGLAYSISLIFYQLGMLLTGQGNTPGTIAALLLLLAIIFLLIRPDKKMNQLSHITHISERKIS
ncbi:MAG: ferrous iron transport protein B [Clostridiales bacterium]|nr:ferrous iron transport protein B [Clostridiales bacterium]